MSSQESGYAPLYKKIDALLLTKNQVIVAVDGNSGAGKTELASVLKKRYGANVFHMDDFFLQPWQRTCDRLEEIGGNVDYERFEKEVLASLVTGGEFAYRRYDCRVQQFVESIRVGPKPLNIVEGVYSLHPTLISYYNLTVFLQISPQEQRERILVRNGSQMLQRFLTEWIPLENRYFQELRIPETADLIF